MRFLLLILVCLLWSATGCVRTTPGDPPSAQLVPTLVSSPTAGLIPTPTPVPLLQQIATDEHRWQQQSITDYRIEVRFVQSIWHVQTHTITVRSGQVVSQTATCLPAPFESGRCTVRPFDPATYTVPGLFAAARAETQGLTAGRQVTIRADPTYGFPFVITSDNPRATDADVQWQVLKFEVLP